MSHPIDRRAHELTRLTETVRDFVRFSQVVTMSSSSGTSEWFQRGR